MVIDERVHRNQLLTIELMINLKGPWTKRVPSVMNAMNRKQHPVIPFKVAKQTK